MPTQSSKTILLFQQVVGSFLHQVWDFSIHRHIKNTICPFCKWQKLKLVLLPSVQARSTLQAYFITVFCELSRMIFLFFSERREPRIYPGPCPRKKCPEDAACKFFENNNTHMCICTHDSLPPTAKGICPSRRTGMTDRFIVFFTPTINNYSCIVQ